MRTLKVMASAMMLLMGASVFAQDFDSFDENGDGMWDNDEFAENYKDRFDNWDSDRDGTIETAEFNESTFRTVDKNADRSIDENEWQEGVDKMYGDYTATMDFDGLDTDEDGRLNHEEWDEAFTNNDDWFVTYDMDRDGALDNEEFSTGIFDDWDDNADGLLDSNEVTVNASYYDDSW